MGCVLKAEDVQDESRRDAVSFLPGTNLTDWLDNSLEFGGFMVTQKNIIPSSNPSSGLYLTSQITYGDSVPQQIASLREDPGDPERSNAPSEHGLLNVDTRVNRLYDPTIQLANMTEEDLSRVDDAMLNRISSLCMGSSSMQSVENMIISRRTGEGVSLNASSIDDVSPLNVLSNKFPRSSISISPNRDLESVSLDSCGFHNTPNHSSSKCSEVSGSKKARTMDDLGSDSEGSYEDVTTPKKTRSQQGPSSKRIRTAETHNESERKRRGKINEKLRALQELIPNANKTDKASILTEAIDYLKKLRLRLQVMCCRNGLILSPILAPQGALHLRSPLAKAGRNINTGINAMVGGESGVSARLQNVHSAPTAATQACLLTSADVQAFSEPPFCSASSLILSTSLGSTVHGLGTNTSPMVPSSHSF
ncbi:hypothetical protein KP509_22G036800 [Ceratopteris richardii]|nr:hypothetical protein KP509_22G036800 [Ceratopteris richardii]